MEAIIISQASKPDNVIEEYLEYITTDGSQYIDTGINCNIIFNYSPMPYCTI